MSSPRPSWSPAAVHGVVGFTLALLIAVGLFFVLPLSLTFWHCFLVWLVGINLSTFAYYGYDKRRAVTGGRRVPERVLHGMALVGGTIGALLAMRLFRHKTLKRSFRLLFGLILIIQVILLFFWAMVVLSSLLIPIIIGVVVGALLVWWATSGGTRRPDSV